MVAPRALWVLVSLLSSACFSPSGTDTQTDSESPSSSTTTTTGLGTTTTTTTTTGPTTSETTAVTTADTTTEVSTSTTSGSTTTTEAATTDPTSQGTSDTETTTTTTTTTGSTTTDRGVCGDGLVDVGEQCDDGNQVDTDACTTSCLDAFCGDGIVHQDVEECDEDGSNCELCKRLWMQVFVSSTATSANLNGLDGADMKCQSLAEDAGLKGRFMAWLSTGDQSAATRLEHSVRPYKRVDDTLVADNWMDLTNGTIANPIELDENGDKVGLASGCGQCPVWAATNPQGDGFAEDCNDWDAALVQTTSIGECSVVDARWTHGCGPRQCNQTARIYCFEQGLPL